MLYSCCTVVAFNQSDNVIPELDLDRPIRSGALYFII
jgi:hypothetical protein